MVAVSIGKKGDSRRIPDRHIRLLEQWMVAIIVRGGGGIAAIRHYTGEHRTLRCRTERQKEVFDKEKPIA